MPTTPQIEAQDPGSFTGPELEQIADIANISLSDANTRSVGLGATQQQAMRADIALWDGTGTSTVALKGGTKGVDYSKERDREKIRRSVRRRLGLPAIDPTLDPNAMQLVTVFPLTWLAADSSSEV